MYEILMSCVYVQEKIIISEKGERTIFTRIKDA